MIGRSRRDKYRQPSHDESNMSALHQPRLMPSTSTATAEFLLRPYNRRSQSQDSHENSPPYQQYPQQYQQQQQLAFTPQPNHYYHEQQQQQPHQQHQEQQQVVIQNQQQQLALDQYKQNPLKWTEQETDKMLQQLEFMTEKVCEDKSRFNKNDVSQLLRALQTAIRQDNLQRDDPLLKQVSALLRELELVDLDKLSSLLHATQQVESELVGRDLLLLSGPSGSGKTTTLHFLAGTEFEEVEVEGFFHLQPTHYADSRVSQYDTSCCRYGVTKSLQTAKVKVDGKTFYICDTPGFDTLESIEEDIAHGIGTIRAIQKARTVRPILVLCKDNLGHRFVNLDKMWSMVTRQFVLGPETGLRPFNYIFTKFEPKHRTRLNQQFAHFKDDLASSASSSRNTSRNRNNSNSKDITSRGKNGKRRSSNDKPYYGQSHYRSQQQSRSSIGTSFSVEEEEVFKSFIDDIVEKTTPEANLVLPMREKPQSLLRQLVRNSYPVSDPMNFFAPLATESSLSKLQIQLEMTLHELSMALAQQEYDLAIELLQKLKTIAQLLPEAEAYSKLGVQAVMQHASLLFKSMSELLTTVSAATTAAATDNTMTTTANQLATMAATYNASSGTASLPKPNDPQNIDYASALSRIRDLEQLSQVVPEVRECTELGEELLWRSIAEAMESHNFARTCTQLTRISSLLRNFPKARAGIQRGLEVKDERILKALKAEDCAEATELLLQVATLAQAYPEAAKSLNMGFKALEEEVLRTIEEKKLVAARDQMQMLAKLVPTVPQAAEFARHGLRLLLNTIEKSIDESEYSMTVNLVKGLLELTDIFPDSNECVNRGIQIIWKIFGLVLEEKHYIRAIGIVQTISALVRISPKAFEYTRMGIEILGDRLLRTIQDKNYSVAMKMLLHLTKLEGDFPETLKSECVAHALNMIKETAEKAIQQKNYEVIIELFRDLMQMDIDVPDAGKCARAMLTMIHEEFERAMKKQNFGLAIELLQQFTYLEEELKEVKEFTQNGQKIFEEVIKDKFETLELLHAIHLIDMLLSHESSLFCAGECARHGLKVIRDEMEKRIDQHDYVSAAEMWHELYQLSLKQPKAKKTVQAGFLLLREVLAASLTEQNYKTATYIMQHMGRVEHDLPEADKCAKQSLTAIKNALLSAIDQEDYTVALEVLQVLVDNSKEFPDAFKCAQFGMKQLQRAVETKIMDKKEYRKALEMMEKAIRLSKDMPDALKCAQVGLKIILKATENAIDQGDYGVAVELMHEVDKMTALLPEAFLCSEIALQAGVRHLSWLRRAVVSVIDQLGPHVPEDKFGNIIRHLKSLLQSIMRAEPLRYLCVKLLKEAMDKAKLDPADEFCVNQLSRLTELVVSELLNIEIDKSNPASLIKMRSSLLSTMVRLKIMNEQLYQCPGGDLVSAAYEEAFKDLHVLLDSVLQTAEHRTTLPENLEIFELQSSFVCHVLNGFLISDLDIADTEMVVIESLEHRRQRLLQQVDEQVLAAKEELDNFAPLNFKSGKEEPSFSYIQRLDMATISAPRKTLLALGKAPTLCELLPSKPAPTDYLVFVKKFDNSLADLMDRIIFFIEKELKEVAKAKQSVDDTVMVANMAKALQADNEKMISTVSLVSQWSKELGSRCNPQKLRLAKVNQALLSLAVLKPKKPSVSLNPFQCFGGA